MSNLDKYPRTKHLEGSKLQPGDEGMGGITIKSIPDDLEWVIEEKVDGANSGFQFNHDLDMLINSRGHFLSQDRNAPREDDWKLLKDYLRYYEDLFLNRFEDKYHVYGEWMNIVHSVFYDNLPHYFLEFDIKDKETGEFLSTDARHELCEGLPIFSVPVIYRGPKIDLKEIQRLASQSSAFQSHKQDGSPDWHKDLEKACGFVNDNYEERLKKMVPTTMMEGVYIKLEKDGVVVDRLKFVNKDFVQTIQNANEHWQSRFPVPNLLGKPFDEFPVHCSSNKSLKKNYDPFSPYDWKHKYKTDQENVVRSLG